MKKILSLLVVLLTTMTSAWADASNLLPGRFSVSADKQVQFTKSNLYWDGSTFKFEANQTDYQTSWDANHIGHFYWTNLTDYQSGNATYMPYASSYSYSSQSTSDKFWCGEDNPLTVEGTSNLYALTSAECTYLIQTRTNASSLCKYGVTVTNGATSYTNCLIIAPDDYSGTALSEITDWSLSNINSLGLVCLPAAGSRDKSNQSYSGSGSWGRCWPATPAGDDTETADVLSFSAQGVTIAPYTYRYCGYPVRLVKTSYTGLTFATPSITMDVTAEQEVKLNLYKGDKALSTLQMNITLPAGISYVDSSAKLGTMADDAELGVQKAEGQNKYTVTILPKATSGSQKEFGTDGEILSFKIKADAALTDTIRITNVIGSTPTAEAAMSLPDVKTPVKTTVTVEENKSATVDTKTTVQTGDASTTSIQTQIASTTTVSGVLLTTTGSNPGTQAVIDAVKASYLTSQNFKTALAAATEVKINVDVQVTPSDYNDGATQGEGKMTYDLKPVATVTAGTETATTDVTNDMIDQLQDIKVNIYTGFKPSAIKHINSSDGKLMEIFTEGNGLTWNEGTNVATVTVHHFSKLIVNQESTDQIAVDGVIAKINSIGTVEYTPACKARIDAARTAYDELTELQQTLVKNTNYRILTDAEKKYQELTPTSINEVNTTTSAQAQGKYFRAGKLIIVKDGKRYNAAGQQVK